MDCTKDIVEGFIHVRVLRRHAALEDLSSPRNMVPQARIPYPQALSFATESD